MSPVPLRREDVVALYRGRYWRDKPVPQRPDLSDLDGTIVLVDDLGALFSERLVFDWQGETFGFIGAEGGQVAGSWEFPTSDERARELGLEGNMYMGYVTMVPESDVDDVRIRHHDLLAAWRHEKRRSASSPHAVYTYERPTTVEEWLHGEWPPPIPR